jgi:acylphosphatase
MDALEGASRCDCGCVLAGAHEEGKLRNGGGWEGRSLLSLLLGGCGGRLGLGDWVRDESRATVWACTAMWITELELLECRGALQEVDDGSVEAEVAGEAGEARVERCIRPLRIWLGSDEKTSARSQDATCTRRQDEIEGSEVRHVRQHVREPIHERP